MNIRMIATDIDGTLLPRGGTISEATRRAVRGCRKRGIPFVIVSGRWIGALGDVVRQAGTEGEPLIIVNGSAVIGRDGAVCFERFMTPGDVENVYRVLRRYDVQINSYVPGGLYCLNTRALKRRSSMLSGYMGVGNLVVDDPARFEREGLDRVYKLEGLTEDTAMMDALRAELEGTGAVVTHSSWRNVEIMSQGMGKATALRWLADSLGIDLADCMAFGDNANDTDMLRAVGWPVAMGNADDALKRMARIVADDDVNDGVAKVIFERVLGEDTP